MISRLDYLLARYREDTITADEFHELRGLLDTGQYDGGLGDLHDDEWDASELQPAAEASAKKEKLRARVFSGRQPARTVPMQRKKSRTQWLWMGAAAAVAMLVVSVMFLFVPKQQENIAVGDETVTPRDFYGRQFITLPDGSTVILNDASQLTYSESFGSGAREVILTGEAYFDVQPDQANPFVVRTGKVKTTVLGTAFNVKAYTSHEEVIVTVTRGKVAVGDDEREYERLLPDEQLAINTTTNDFKKTNINSDAALAWKSEFLILDRVTMEEAARIIGERFHTKVTITNEGLKNCIIKGAFLNGEGPQHIVASITMIMKATYRIEDGNIIIDGGRVCE